MEVTGLGRYAGMLFAFPSVGSGQFYMLNTRIPLSIAFFAEDGRFVSATDMQPCLGADASACPLYERGRPVPERHRGAPRWSQPARHRAGQRAHRHRPLLLSNRSC